MYASFSTLCIWTYEAYMRQSKPKVSICHCIDLNQSALQLKMQVQNTLNGSTLRPSNHNCKNIRLHVKTDERNTFSSATAHCTTAKTVCADVSLNTSSRAQVCAWKSAKPGMQYRNNKGGNTLRRWTAQVTAAETHCGSAWMACRFRGFEPCRCAPGMSHTQRW